MGDFIKIIMERDPLDWFRIFLFLSLVSAVSIVLWKSKS